MPARLGGRLLHVHPRPAATLYGMVGVDGSRPPPALRVRIRGRAEDFQSWVCARARGPPREGLAGGFWAFPVAADNTLAICDADASVASSARPLLLGGARGAPWVFHPKVRQANAIPSTPENIGPAAQCARSIAGAYRPYLLLQQTNPNKCSKACIFRRGVYTADATPGEVPHVPVAPGGRRGPGDGFGAGGVLAGAGGSDLGGSELGRGPPDSTW
jgi:hypothetical protein